MSIYLKLRALAKGKGKKTLRVVLLNIKLGRVRGQGAQVRVRDLARTLRVLSSRERGRENIE